MVDLLLDYKGRKGEGIMLGSGAGARGEAEKGEKHTT